ncbi:MAG: ABC transporter permease subunit [Actinomyces urogenitalis]|uniref:Sugar ABC transporter permease n=1 Tax=Actinomyces urogenitalis TaxID=103621 RepID=A0A2I1KR16_9ACTO|nr:ABC transporter permease subunit [Actinomyces urogenitalis]KGF02459.1 sugar ABC transporter permease [Actinomyces urogenitalis S6-C4]MBS5977935.1 sugar ABC transporter permease [Actinomyces urogenitalis]MDU0972919.1 ABC transporter permease subunit [Actinomyces urogenitalis]PKY98062.1 sugar ABC transporter permease [Actinomyces urogenitalis]
MARHWQLYLLLAPAVIYLIVFKYWPMYGVQIAFRNYNPIDGFMGSEWVGLEHISRFLHSFQFSRVFVNTIAINVLGLVFGFPVPIVLALLINQLGSRRLKSFIQTVLFSPAFISTVVVVGMLFVLLSPRSGLVNNVISLAGGTPVSFMNEEGWFRPIYVLSDIWQNAGFSMIIYLAALAGIDPSLHEAARVDGANRWQRLWHIDLPGIRPVISIMLILAVGNLLNIGFEKALLMQTDLNLGTSQIIQTYVYDVGLKSAQFSYSAAISLFNYVLNMILLLVFNQGAKRAGQTSLF